MPSVAKGPKTAGSRKVTQPQKPTAARASAAKRTVRFNDTPRYQNSSDSDASGQESEPLSTGSDDEPQQAAQPADLFAAVRRQASSGLPNQRHVATTLATVEEAVTERGSALTPMAYFGVITGLLRTQAAVLENSTEDATCAVMVASLTQLLQIALPEISALVLRRHFIQVGAVLLAVAEASHGHAATQRHCIAAFGHLMVAQSYAGWRAAASMSRAATDEAAALLRAMVVYSAGAAVAGAPKVRRAAREMLVSVLSRPPPPVLRHPASLWVTEQVADAFPENPQQALALLVTLAPVLAHHLDATSRQRLGELAARTAKVARDAANEVYTRLSALQVLEALAVGATAQDPERAVAVLDGALLDVLARELLDVYTSVKDEQRLYGAWVDAVGRALLRLGLSERVALGELLGSVDRPTEGGQPQARAAGESDAFPALVLRVWEALFGALATAPRGGSVLKTLCTECVSDAAVKAASFAAGGEPGVVAGPILAPLQTLSTGLSEASLFCARGVILEALEALFLRLGAAREAEACTTAELAAVMGDTVRAIVLLRDEASGEGSRGTVGAFEAVAKEHTQCLAAAVRALGMQTFTELVPLRLDGAGEGVPRPWLLPIFKTALQDEASAARLRDASEDVGDDSDGSLSSLGGDSVGTAGTFATTAGASTAASTLADARLAPQLRRPVFGVNSLSFFAKELLPLTRKLFARASALHARKKSVEAKLWETLAQQVLELVGPLCATAPADVEHHFYALGKFASACIGDGWVPALLGPAAVESAGLPTDSFAMQQAVDGHVCAALIELVMGQVALAGDDAVSVGLELAVRTQARQNVVTLRTAAGRMLEVLCRRYTRVARDDAMSESTEKTPAALRAEFARDESARKSYKSAILAWLQLAESASVESYFSELLQTLLETQTALSATTDASPLADVLYLRHRVYALLDLVVALVPSVGAGIDGANAQDSAVMVLYQALATQLRDTDAGVQKRTYRGLVVCLGALGDACTMASVAPELIPSTLKLAELVDALTAQGVGKKAAAGVRKARFECFLALLDRVPLAARDMLLELVPRLLPELIVGTKETGHRARQAAFHVLTRLGFRMLHIGQTTGAERDEAVSDASVFAMSPLGEALDADAGARAAQQARKAQVSLREYLAMVAGGLGDVGDTHLVSATVSCLAHLLFEFRAALSPAATRELVSAVLPLVASRDRAVAKAALGFAKVTTLALDRAVANVFLADSVSLSLACRKNHPARFNQRVRHLFERLVRRFSLETIAELVPEEDQPLLASIRKQRNRAAKRQKAGAEAPPELRDHDGDEDLPDAFREPRAGAAVRGVAQLRETGADGPLDLLDARLGARLVAPARKRRRGGDSDDSSDDDAGVRTDRETGQLVIDEPKMAVEADENPSFDAVKQVVAGEDAFERTPSGRIRFLRRPGAAAEVDGDDDDDDAAQAETLTERKRRRVLEQDQRRRDARAAAMLGTRYRASKAGGDVKRANMPDPFAYIPLQAKIVGNKHKSTKVQGSFRNLVAAAKRGSRAKRARQ